MFSCEHIYVHFCIPLIAFSNISTDIIYLNINGHVKFIGNILLESLLKDNKTNLYGWNY